MVSRGFKELLAAANAEIDVVSAAEAMSHADGGDAVFVDVRESQENQAGAIPGAVHAPRGFLEFIADPAGPMHNPALASGKKLIVYCASGGRSALAAQTLKGMGIENVVNLAGGIAAWKEAGGAVE